LIAGIVVLVEVIVNTECHDFFELSALVKGFVDVHSLMVLKIPRLNIHVLGSEQVRDNLAVVQRLLPKEKEKHINLNHPLHLDVLQRHSWLLRHRPLLGLRNRLILKQSNFLTHIYFKKYIYL